ncbi:G-type lectin S-receptor-like serine/threonine-protein kinase At4g27290 [Cryptomeria japonica]|uniref:G-type lectin S-receptor-like serine/threonine-protein kinase At4g27290 n=1 Tax=Cryptomeria japonica TaxID=3369 RepID=UPI0027DA8236|nr:G-type lectin S-receptor-like serine/threonine-protein kinase At4g27290 [Cryptomeria japonica]
MIWKSLVNMNDCSKAIVFLAVLVSDWLYTSTWAETFPPLNCSTSSVRSCDAYIYLRNVTEPLKSVASRFNISTQEITPFIGPNYLAKIQCSCSDFLGVEGFFYKVNYTVQASDVGLYEREISDKYFSYTAWTEKQFRTYKTGDKVHLALGCGCPIPGWHSTISYAVPPKGTLWKITRKFQSNISDIIRLNNIPNRDLIRANRVYFVPYQTDRNTSTVQSPLTQPSNSQSKGTQQNQHKYNKRQIKLKVSLSIAAAILLLVLSIIIFYYGCCNRASSPPQSSTAIENGQTENWVAPKSETITGNGTEQEEEEQEQLDQSLSLPIITNLTHGQIIQMKSYCTQRYEIGEGSFGRVYKGNLKEKEVAIKKIKRAGRDSKKFVENEVRLLQGKEHKNLVSLIEWCIEENTFYLVYEYVDGCTLDEYLRGSCSQFSLNWKQCLRMISSIAEGIEFLHLNNIIHLDIKPQNLMVDSKDKEVKIIDFGLSRHVDWEGTHRSTDRIAGTRGYWAPEYCLSHKLSYKHDVYSFGIVVLEVITGQKHVDNARGSSQFHIPDYVRYMMACNRLEEALDERLRVEGFDECDLKDALAVVKLGLKCAERDKEERPDMSYVVRLLNTMSKENTEGNSSEMGD